MPLSVEDIFAAFDKPPEKALEFLKSKDVAVTWDWKSMTDEARAASFTMAKVMQLDIVQDMHDMLKKAAADGQTFADFKKEARNKLATKGWLGEREVTNEETGETSKVNLGSPWRLRVIYQTNLQSAYMAGRHLSMLEVTETRPYWMNRSVLDKRTTSRCAELDGTVFAWDDPIWSFIDPPGHPFCRRRKIAVNDRYLKKKGLVVSDGGKFPAEKFGNSEGFQRSLSDRWSPNLSKYRPEFVDKYKEAFKKAGIPDRSSAIFVDPSKKLLIQETENPDNINEAIEKLSSVIEVQDWMAKVKIVKDDAHFKRNPEEAAYFDRGTWQMAFNKRYEGSGLERGNLYHEFGHYIAKTQSIANNVKYREFINTAKSTEGFKKAVAADEERKKKKLDQYWTVEEEIWTRAFAQFVSKKAGDEMAWRNLQMRSLQWDEQEFNDLEDKIKAVIEEAGFKLK